MHVAPVFPPTLTINTVHIAFQVFRYDSVWVEIPTFPKVAKLFFLKLIFPKELNLVQSISDTYWCSCTKQIINWIFNGIRISMKSFSCLYRIAAEKIERNVADRQTDKEKEISL